MNKWFKKKQNKTINSSILLKNFILWISESYDKYISCRLSFIMFE